MLIIWVAINPNTQTNILAITLTTCFTIFLVSMRPLLIKALIFPLEYMLIMNSIVLPPSKIGWISPIMPYIESLIKKWISTTGKGSHFPYTTKHSLIYLQKPSNLKGPPMASSKHSRGNIAALALLNTPTLRVLPLYYVGGCWVLSFCISHGYMSLQSNQVCKHF